jgi:hypothetical protein
LVPQVSAQSARRLKAKTVFTCGSIPHFELNRASSLQVQVGLQLLSVAPGSGKIRCITCTVRLASVVKSMSSEPYPGKGIRRAGAFALMPTGYAQPTPTRYRPANNCHTRLLACNEFVLTVSYPNRTRKCRRDSCTPHLTRPSAPSPRSACMSRRTGSDGLRLVFGRVARWGRVPAIRRLLNCTERTGRNADHAAATAARVDRGQIAALVLDDGARLAHQPRLARGARLTGVGVDPEDGAHDSRPFCCSSITEGGPAPQTISPQRAAPLHR